MQKIRPSKKILIERIVIAWALLATAAYFVQKATANYTFDYGFLSCPAYESRFEGLDRMLPALGKVFYVADPMADRSTEIDLNRELLARYCLAPYLSPDADLLYQVTDFHHPIDLQQWAQDHQLVLVRNFQDGVALFRKKDYP
jgi:hypothetical protein